MIDKKDMFDSVVGIILAFGFLGAGYYAGRKKATWEEMNFDNRMDALETRISGIENQMYHIAEEEPLE